mgnify:CR=1 FL=1
MKITAEIEPVPLARTQINTFNRGRFLTARSQQFKRDLGIIAGAAMHGQKIFTGALSLKINLYKNCAITSRRYGDADNHAKAILDACNGIIFLDDAQVVSLQVVKHKSATQKVVIEIDEYEISD